jgi:predicted MFS family arabinose efflux permease
VDGLARAGDETTLGETAAVRAPRRTVLVMAVGCGAVVANLYYAQPLEDTLARRLAVGPGVIGVILTLIQIGYAIGLATLMPLGDLVERRRLLAVMLAVAVAGLTTMALAPGAAVLGSAAVLVGVSTSAAQVIVPFAAHIAGPAEQGRVVSTVMSGLLIGILVSRTVAGLVAQVGGWRLVFGAGAVLTAAIAVLLWRELPRVAPTARMSYRALLGSVVRLAGTEPVLRRRTLYGMAVFASFSAFWASAGFLLAGPGFGWNNAQIGLFALIGVAGAVAARFAGRLADAGRSRTSTGLFLIVMAASYGLLAIGAHSVVALAIGVALMDLGCQGAHITNQALIYPLRPAARSRLNTVYMTCYFVAGATGSGLSATLVYPRFGWAGVCVLGAAFPAAATLLWLAESLRDRTIRRRADADADAGAGAGPAAPSGAGAQPVSPGRPPRPA